jgi:hypothetical protein
VSPGLDDAFTTFPKVVVVQAFTFSPSFDNASTKCRFLELVGGIFRRESGIDPHAHYACITATGSLTTPSSPRIVIHTRRGNIAGTATKAKVLEVETQACDRSVVPGRAVDDQPADEREGGRWLRHLSGPRWRWPSMTRRWMRTFARP